MKTLYIIRHWKSSWENPLLDDFDRPLSDKGKNSVKLIWEKLKEKKINPDLVLSSPAKRAKKTAEKISESLWYKKEKIIFEKWIYDNHMKWVDYYLALIMWIKDKYNSVFIVWHNYAWNELANYLIWKDIWNIPTSWVVCIKFKIKSWKEISYSNWNLSFFIYPKMYN
jgi:phosphohistidine phosphatase